MYQNNYNGLYNSQQFAKPIQQQGLKGRPVSSLEEARAASVDFDGSIFFFPDLASNRIYTKQINIDGTASLKMYEYKEIPIESNSNDYITRKEFDQTLIEIKNSLAALGQGNSQTGTAKEELATQVAKQF